MRSITMRSLVTSLLLALAGATAASSAFAVPQINVISSETVSTVPPRYKTTFTIQFVGYMPPGAYYGFDLESSGLGAPVTFHGAESPAYPWQSHYAPTMAEYFVDGGGFQGLLQFSVTTDQQVPCVTITFLDMLLSKTPTRQVQNNYVVKGCLAVDMPTPAAQATWGSVKAFYR